MRRKRVIMIGVILLIGINIALLAIDNEHNVERKSFIKKWSNVVQKDMFEFLNTGGVMSSTKEENIYFDKQLGSFQAFLIEEGELVSEGDELYAYRVHSFVETESYLEQEIDKINEEISALESVIDSIDNYSIPQIPPIQIQQENEDIIEIPRSSGSTEWMKEQYKIEKEKELGLKEAQLESVEAQLKTLEQTGHTVTVTSPYEGRVTMLSKSLNDPILSIETTDLQIEGELVEKERPELTEGLAVDIYSPTTDEMFEGVIAKVDEIPNHNEVNEESFYEFDVSFSEEADLENVLLGYHVDLRIKTKEALQTTVVPDKAVIDNTLWKMTKEGELIEQHVQTGIHMGKWYEVTEGASLNEWIALEPFDQFRQDTTFVTPLKITQLSLKETLKNNKEGRKQSILLGLLYR